MLSVEERESKCYEYFHENSIENRDQLRKCWKTNPIHGVRSNFIEDIFSDFQERKKIKEQKSDEIQSNTKYFQSFVLGDLHIPFHDKETINNVFDCVIDNQPKYLIFVGDVIDCYSISRFLKKPDKYRNLQEEINIFYKLMKDLRKDLPNTEIHYIMGNHEERLETLILQNSGLYGLKNLEYEKVLRLDELNIKFHPIKLTIDNYIYKHGDIVRKNPGASAKAEYEKHRMHSGISGHTHRAASYYSTYSKEIGQWYENGCLCSMSPEYINDPDTANWQQAFTVINYFDQTTQGTQILIQDHKFCYNGKIYK